MRSLLITSMLMISSHCFSQGFTGNLLGRLRFGLKAGVNYSDYTNATFGTEGLVAYHAGLLVNFRISKAFSVQEEFLFSSQGAKIKDGQLGTGDFHVYYLSVPFLLQYKTPFGLYLEAGPQFGMRLKEDLQHSTLDNFSKKLDIAAAGGIGFKTKIGLGISARYIAGLSKAGDFKLPNVATDFRTNMAQASIFYIF